MSQKLQPVRGTHDLLPEDFAKHRFIADTARATAARYGFAQVDTPVFEFSDVFHRTLGDTSDVVSKETYSFEDRGGESITLRPEFTASLARAFISNGMQQQVPCRWFHHGPAFRYERPQKGRQRQFHQIGCELFGAPEWQGDVEMIALAHAMLEAFGLKDHIRLELNTLGDRMSRANYRDKLVTYFTQYEAMLSEDSKTRLHKNPLRILDSKDEGDRKIIANAPRMAECLNPHSKDFFAKLQEGLTALNIGFTLNETLVRGLDYYNHTVFECVTDLLGAQGTVLAGGRYDGLIATMGGPDVAGIGFAAGVERLAGLRDALQLPAAHAVTVDVAVVPLGDEAEIPALKLLHHLRKSGFSADMAYKGNAGKRFKRADKLGAKFALVLGEDEVKTGTAMLKSLATGTQESIAQSDVIAALKGEKN